MYYTDWRFKPIALIKYVDCTRAYKEKRVGMTLLGRVGFDDESVRY